MANDTQYRIRCETDGEQFIWADAPPTECPIDGGHTLVSGSTAIVSHKECTKLAFTMQNNGAVLNSGVQEAAYLEVPFKCKVLACHLFGGPTGSIVLDLWADSYASYPPTDADSITAAAPPTISSGVKSEDTDVTGWTTVLSAGTGILINIDSVVNMTWAKLVLEVEKLP